jgi:hypothetical protein
MCIRRSKPASTSYDPNFGSTWSSELLHQYYRFNRGESVNIHDRPAAELVDLLDEISPQAYHAV